MIIFFISFITLFSLVGSPHATDPTEKELLIQWGKEVNEYREYLIKKNRQGTLELRSLLIKWNSLKVTIDDQEQLTLNILVGVEIYGLNINDVKKKMKKYHPDSAINGNFTETDLKTITRNAEMLNLINLSVLKPIYPF